MLKDYLRKKGITTYALSQSSEVAYSTLNDLVNGKVDIDNCKISLLRALCNSLDISMEDFCDICKGEKINIRNSYDTEVSLKVRNKAYYAEFEYRDKPVELKLCKVKKDTTFYIDSIAEWRVNDYIRSRRMEEFK